MSLLRTPKTKHSFEKYTGTIVFLSPIIVIVHFFYQMINEVYPPEADSIMIGIMGFLIFHFPILLILKFISVNSYERQTPLLNWNKQNHTWSIFVSFFSLWLLLGSISFLIDSLLFSFSPTSFFFALYFHVILCLRSSLIGIESTPRANEKWNQFWSKA